jgi:hypothetical protein
MIFELAMVNPYGLKYGRWHGPPSVAAVLLVCHQFHDEGKRFLWRNDFQLGESYFNDNGVPDPNVTSKFQEVT